MSILICDIKVYLPCKYVTYNIYLDDFVMNDNYDFVSNDIY